MACAYAHALVGSNPLISGGIFVGHSGLPRGFWHKTHKCALPCIEGAATPRYAGYMAIYHLSHRTVGRTTHAAGTAGAHVGYITRASACRAVIAEHIPEAAPGSKGGAARAWLDAQEEADRKNARVIDKLEIALPIELDQAQRVELVRAFVLELAGGRAVPFFAAIHDKAGTKDEANPHAHVVIRDRDPATGKGRVIGMSEKGSTERAREIWEQICNEALRDAGHSARVDRRSLVDQGITDRAAPGHEGPQPRQIEAKGKASEKLARLRDARKTPAKLHSALERAAERESEVNVRLSMETASDASQRRTERLIAALRGRAEAIWRNQRDKKAAAKASRLELNSALNSRVFPEAISQHFKDISTIVFRRQRKQPMPLRDISVFAGSQQMEKPQQPDQRSKFRLSF